MSRDFFNVSSILQAVKSAAAAASCMAMLLDRCHCASAVGNEAYHETVLSIRVLKAEFVVIHHGGVECLDWSVPSSATASKSAPHITRSARPTAD